MKTALVTFIRNEAKDVLAWLAWHIKLGIDSFIIFDDGSTDGTLELLKTASSQYDIRLFSIKNAHNSFTERQRIAYLDAIYGLKNHFDWIGFLDSDEYLALYRHNNIKDFLEQFDMSVGAVGIHWCLYGSDGHLTQPDMPTPYAFTHHSPREHIINRHVKTFLRPNYWNEEWINPHYFPLIKGKHYVSPEGRRHFWSKTLGITHINAVWESARIMHFQNRSLEEFLERTRRYEEYNLSLTDFKAHDLNDIQDTRPQSSIKDILTIMRNIIFQGIAETLESLPPSTKTKNIHEQEHHLTISHLIPWNKTCLEIHSSLVFPHDNPQNGSALLLMQSSHIKDYGFLFALDHTNHPLDFSILNDSRLVFPLAYEICPLDDETYIALRKFGGVSKKRAYISVTEQKSPLSADREKADLWEGFHLKTLSKPSCHKEWHDIALIKFIRHALSKPITLTTLKQLPYYDRKLTIHCLPIFSLLLPEDERKTLIAHLGPLAPFIL